MPDSSASAPGSLMLMGEHAVLQASHALSCAVNLRMHVALNWRSDEQVHIHSSLGSYSSQIHDLHPDSRFTFVLACLEGIPRGLELTITSEFSPTVGLGSSAAVTVATIAAIHGPTLSRLNLFQKSLKVIQSVQKVGSGADVAASVFGGIVLYRMNPLLIEKIATTIPLTLIYSGNKLATQEVIKRVLQSKTRHAQVFDTLYALVDRLVLSAKEALLTQDLRTLGELFTLHHGIQEAIGTCNKPLAEIVHLLRCQSSIYGAKISGSGLGDCAIGLGNCTLTSHFQQIPVSVSLDGVSFT